jgi:signal transduction histidine kinase/CRP-like cAMP-binding protein
MFQNKNSAAVKKNRLFAGIPDSEFKLKFNPQNFLELKEGEIIYQRGEESNFIYLILEGEVKIKFIWTQEQRGLVRKYRDEFFGDDELLAKSFRRSSAVALTECLLYKISKKELEYIASLNTPLLTNLGLSENATDLYNYSDESKIEFRTTTEKLEVLNELDNLSIIENVEIPPVAVPEISSNINLDDDTEFLSLNVHPGINKTDFFKQELLDEPEDDTTIRFSDTIEEDKPAFDSAIQDADNTGTIPNDQFDLTDDIPGEVDSSTDETISVPETIDEEIIIDDDQYINLHSGLNLNETLSCILLTARNLTESDKGIIHLSSELNNSFDRDIKTGSNEIRLLSDEGLAWKSALKKEIIIENVFNTVSYYTDATDSSVEYKVNNTLCFPLVDETQSILFVIQLFNSRKGSFSGSDEKKLNLLSRHFLSAVKKSIEISELIKTSKRSALKDISDFIISDIKIPLQTIQHYSALLKKQNFSSEVKNIFDILSAQANAVVDLTRTSFEYALDSKSVNRVISNSGTVVDEILILLSEYVESRKIKLFKKIESNAKVEIDKHAFYQVLFQVTKNACDSMPGGGNIFVTCSNDDDYIRIDIRDEGPGISIADQDKLFIQMNSPDKFEKHRLGLAIVKKIITELNGSISVQSNLGEGTTFIIFLPLIKD